MDDVSAYLWLAIRDPAQSRANCFRWRGQLVGTCLLDNGNGNVFLL